MRKIVIVVFFIAISLMYNSYTYALCVKVPEANLRSGPGTNHKKTWKVYMHMPFKELSKKGGWYKVQDVDGDVHWIFGKLVTNKMKCAVVKANKANVRNGPGLKFKKTFISPVIKYYSFKVLKRKDKWVKVIDEYNNSGWIFKDLLWIQ